MKADEKRMANFDEAETTVNETVDECKVQNVVGAKWKHVAIGGAAGIMMGVAGAVVGTEGAEAAETGMNAANHTPDATGVPVAASVNDEMSFGEAFAAARAEVGAGGVFEWHGNTYNTYYAEEWEAMSPAEREGFFAAVAGGNAAPVATVQNVEVVDEGSSDNDVRVIGVYEGQIEGHDVYVGAMEIEGDEVMLVDVDHDGVFDIAISDINSDGEISDNEVEDISGVGIGVEDFAARAAMESANDLLAANDMPDYVNDADVSMC